MRGVDSNGSFSVRFLGETPRVVLKPKVDRRIRLIVDCSDGEVSFLGTVERKSKYIFVVTEVFLVEQMCNFSETTLLAEGQLELMGRLMRDDPNGYSKIERLRFWGHSHGKLDVFVSSRDDATFLRLAHDGRPFQIMAIFNRKGERYAEVALSDEGVVLQDVPIVVEEKPFSDTELAEMRATLGRYVTQVPDIIAVNSGKESGDGDSGHP